MIDQEQIERQQAEQRRVDKLARAQLRQDTQDVMTTPAGRRLVFAFLFAAGSDQTGYRDNPTAMAHAAGWQDAARWWLAAIREHCPERETDMRAEARRAARQTNQDTDE